MSLSPTHGISPAFVKIHITLTRPSRRVSSDNRISIHLKKAIDSLIDLFLNRDPLPYSKLLLHLFKMALPAWALPMVLIMVSYSTPMSLYTLTSPIPAARLYGLVATDDSIPFFLIYAGSRALCGYL